MNNLSYRALRATSLTFLTSVLVILYASGGVVCQQSATSPLPATEPQGDAGPVVFSVTVTNKKGDFVTGLNKSHFLIQDDKKATQDVTYFKAQDEPLSVGIILDVSISMFRPVQRDLTKTLFKEALLLFLRRSNPSNNYFLISFNQQPQLVVDWTSDMKEIDAALHKLEEVKPTGNGAALYDACHLGFEKLSRGTTHPKRVLLLVTAGEDNGSHHTFEELRKSLGQSNVLLYGVGLSGALDASAEIGLIYGHKVMNLLATTTGGVAVFPVRPDQVPRAFDQVSVELRHQYSIGFSPASPPSKPAWRKVKVKLNLPSDAPSELQNLVVRSREEYYANVTQP